MDPDGCYCDSNHEPTTDGSNCGSGGSGPVPTMTPPWTSTMMPTEPTMTPPWMSTMMPTGVQCPPATHEDMPGMGCYCDSNHALTTDGSNCGSGGSGPVPTMTPPWMSTMMPIEPTMTPPWMSTMMPTGVQCPLGAHDDGPGMGCVCDSNHEPTTDGSNCGGDGSGPVPTMTPPWMP